MEIPILLTSDGSGVICEKFAIFEIRARMEVLQTNYFYFYLFSSFLSRLNLQLMLVPILQYNFISSKLVLTLGPHDAFFHDFLLVYRQERKKRFRCSLLLVVEFKMLVSISL